MEGPAVKVDIYIASAPVVGAWCACDNKAMEITYEHQWKGSSPTRSRSESTIPPNDEREKDPLKNRSGRVVDRCKYGLTASSPKNC
jgi:hypothetical protein